MVTNRNVSKSNRFTARRCGEGWLYANTKTITDMSWDLFHFKESRRAGEGGMGSLQLFLTLQHKPVENIATSVTSRLMCP